MKIILVRHGQSVANKKGIKQGQKIDTSLSEKGIDQSEKVADRLENINLEAIYSSDLKRARETATIIAERHGLEVETDKRLREKARYDGETARQHIERTDGFFRDIEKNHNGDNIVIVGHRRTNRAIMAIMTGDKHNSVDLVETIGQENTCVNIAEKNEDGYEFRLINCKRHLESN